jgi:glutamate racemase
VENFEYDSPGADYFVRRRIDSIMDRDPKIDLLLLGCTHFPFLIHKIKKYTPAGVRVIAQGEYVAKSLKNYLRRHPEMDARCTKNGQRHFLTTEDSAKFDETARFFLQEKVESEHIDPLTF